MAIPRWWVEHASLRRVPVATVWTLLISTLLPFLFWRRLRMSMPVRGGRLASYALVVLVAPPWLVVVLSQGCEARSRWRFAQHSMKQLAERPARMSVAADGESPWPGAIRAEHAKLRPASIDTSGAAFFLRWTLLPLSTASPGAITTPEGWLLPLPAPAEALQWRLREAREIDGARVKGARHAAVGGAMVTSLIDRVVDGTSPTSRWHGAVAIIAGGLAVVLPPCVCIALWQIAAGGATYLVLPQTRRRAKVTWSHIARVVAYAASAAAIPAVVPLVTVFVRGGWVPGTARSPGHSVSVLGLVTVTDIQSALLCRMASLYAIPVLLWIWWSMAGHYYLKLPHAWAVGLAQAIIGASVTLAIYPLTLGWMLE